jgi:dehydrogenase/reductase SDR family protein 12
MEYRITTFDPPHLIVLDATAERSRATATIRFRESGDGTEVDWTLDLELLGVSRLSEPFLDPVLRRLARVALDGLVADLSGGT